MQATFTLSTPSSVITNEAVTIPALKARVERLDSASLILLCVQLNLLTNTARIKTLQAMHDAQTEALILLLVDNTLSLEQFNLLQHFRMHTQIQQGQPAFVFSRQGLLELIRCLCLWSTLEGRKHPQKSKEGAFLLALLNATEISTGRQQRYFPGTASEGTLSGIELEQFRRNYQPMMRLTAYYAPPNRDILFHLGRARLLLFEEFFDKNPQHASRFSCLHGGLTVEQYVACVTAIMMTKLYNQPSSVGQISLSGAFSFNVKRIFAESEHMREPFQRYVDLKGQSLDELCAAFRTLDDAGPSDLLNLRPIRVKPLFRINSEEAIVIDEKLFAESLSVGPLFSLLGQGKDSDIQTFSDFGYACHRYALRLIKACDSFLPTSGKALMIVGEPTGKYLAGERKTRSLGDIAILDRSEAALFETKGRWFNDSSLESIKSFWKEIYRIYGISTHKGKVERHGYAQLADAISLLASNNLEAVGDSKRLNDVATIYPVLLTHDELVVAPNFQHLLALDFIRELGFDDLPESGAVTVGKYRVNSLILLSFTDLEYLQARKLEKSIISYLGEYSKWSPDRTETLNEFFWQKYPGMERRSENEQLLLRASTDAINDTAKLCFPDKFQR